MVEEACTLLAPSESYRIDDLVCELYGITSEERRIIEGGPPDGTVAAS